VLTTQRRTVRRSHSVRGTSTRRKLVWSFVNGSFTGSAANQAFDLLGGLEVAGASKLGCTVVRTHLQFVTLLSAAGTFLDFFQIGLRVATVNDVATNDLAPFSRPDEDWAWNQTFWVEDGDTQQWMDPSNPVGAVIDCRAKRKVEELQETWALAVEPALTVGTTAQREAQAISDSMKTTPMDSAKSATDGEQAGQ